MEHKPWPYINLMDYSVLLDKSKSGDKVAEDELFRNLSVRFRLFAHRKIMDRLDAEEVVQNSLASIARKYRETEIEKSFIAWAHKVLTNEILNYYRKKARYEKRFGDSLEDGDSVEGWRPDTTIRKKLLNCLRQLLGFNNMYARILNLHYQGFNTDEVCSRMKISRNHSYVTLFRARTMLEDCLKKGKVSYE